MVASSVCFDQACLNFWFSNSSVLVKVGARQRNSRHLRGVYEASSRPLQGWFRGWVRGLLTRLLTRLLARLLASFNAFNASRVQGFRASRLQGSNSPRFSRFWVSGFQDFNSFFF